tara:strand:+ start:565 stop:666 length:102 start_codon:yes stop_codon:yes gene_type:complete
MDFIKIKDNKYKSKMGIVFTEKQMINYKKRFNK